MFKLFDNQVIKINPEKVKFFPANSCNSACSLYESLMVFGNTDEVKNILIIDGDDAGQKALNGLINRLKNNSISIRCNKDYFQLSKCVESLISERIKEILISERPSQVLYTRNTDGKITNFSIQETDKKKVAHRVIELSNLDDLDKFKSLLLKIEALDKIDNDYSKKIERPRQLGLSM